MRGLTALVEPNSGLRPEPSRPGGWVTWGSTVSHAPARVLLRGSRLVSPSR
jgi:hypothetical protein